MYTKEEWKIEDGRFVYALNRDGVNRFSAGITGGYADNGRTTLEELEANANLIVAAPNGLQAAEGAYIALLLSGVYRLTVQAELCQLRDFIAKATNRCEGDVQNEYEALAEGKE